MRSVNIRRCLGICQKRACPPTLSWRPLSTIIISWCYRVGKMRLTQFTRAGSFDRIKPLVNPFDRSSIIIFSLRYSSFHFALLLIYSITRVNNSRYTRNALYSTTRYRFCGCILRLAKNIFKFKTTLQTNNFEVQIWT